MPPRSEAGVSTNETTNNQQNNSSSLIVNNSNNSNNLTMSNQANPIHPNTGVQLNNNGLHQPVPHNSSHFPGAYQAPPDLYGNANKSSLPPSPYNQPPHWQGNVYRPQMMPPNPYAANPAAFSPYQSPHNRLPNSYNQQNPYMNYPPIPPQNSQYNSSSMMPPPNNYPKMSPQQMYPPPPRASTQPQLIPPPPPTGHSYPPTGHGLQHQYSHQYAYNKMPYFNGFLPYPPQAPMPPYGYPTDYNPTTGLPPPDSSHHLSAVQPQSSHKTEFNGNQSEINSNNNNNQQDQTSENNLNNSLNKTNNNSTLTSQQSPIPNAAIIDEASQASTSSSHTEDRTDTPKSSKQHSHPTTPNLLLGSPSAVSLQDELENNNLSNPSWPRTPASPAINSAEHAKNKKADSLQKLYEMSDEPDRRIFLDKLVQFNNENGITLNSCPHISKSLIDLYKLYYLVKERGGFADITKKKLWKEVAILLNLPIASTTSYTLRKQYIKHMLPFECKFDRNGIDPQKLLAQVESTSKKKSVVKNSSISPQPVDNNSQGSYPQSSTPQLNSSNNKPHSPIAQTPNLQSPNFQNLSYQQIQQQQNSSVPPYHLQQTPLQPNQQPQLNDENYQRKMSAYKSGNLPPSSQPNKSIDYYQNYDAYNRSGNKNMTSQMQNQYSPRSMQPSLSSNQNAYPQSADQNYQNFNLIRGQSQLAERLLKSKPSSPQANYQQSSSLNHQNYSTISSNQQMKSAVNMPYPKRHPDFNKIEQPQSFSTQQPPNNYSTGQPPSSQYIQQTKPENYSNANEFLSNSFLNNYNKQQQSLHHRQPASTFSEQQSKSPYPSPFYPPSQQTLTNSSSLVPHTASTAPTTTIHHPTLAPINQIREIQFPPDSIEAVKPIFVKRKKLTSKDISQIDPWKLMMSLKSGLLAETTWALDVLSILLHDDNTYMYFGLQNLPGLLELLIEHFKLYLSELFEGLFKDIELENNEDNDEENSINNKPTFEETFIKKVLEANEKFKKKYNSEIEETTNGLENGIDSDKEENNHLESSSKNKKFKKMKLTKLDTLSYHLEDKQVVLSKCENYTLKNRKGLPVYFVDDENLFINDFSKKWDKLNRKSIKTDTEHWKKTFFSSTDFIQRTFQPPDNNLCFIKTLKLNKEEDNHLNGNSDNNSNSIELRIDKSKNGKMEEEIIDQDDEEEDKITYPRFREKIKLKRFLEDHENEAYVRDSPPLCNLNDYRESIAKKCICFSTLIRNLSFVPGNEAELSKNTALLLILGRLLLLHHKHLEKKSSKLNLTNLDDSSSLFNENTELDSDMKFNSKEDDDSEWWYDTLIFLRENALVTISNISGTLNLSKYNEEISLPIFKGLLHWVVCTSSIALDNFKTSSITTLSPSRLSLEALSRMSILESNVDLILSTPPHNRDITIFETLVNHLRRNEDQTIREFALVLIYNFIMADPNVARTVALTTDAIQQLIVYIETAEQNALNFISQQGIHNFKENSETLGTTVDMVKRAALCLKCLAKIQENHNLFFTYQQRLVQLVMSSIFDQKITRIISDILYEISVDDSFHFKYLNNNSNNLKRDLKELKNSKNINDDDNNDSNKEEEDNDNNNLKTDLKSVIKEN